MNKDDKLEKLNLELKRASKLSSEKLSKARAYEPYVVVGLAFMFIVAGLLSGNLDNGPTAFVVVDLTQEEVCQEEWFCTDWTECSSDNSQFRQCLDFNVCESDSNKPSIEQECEWKWHEQTEASPLTGMVSLNIESGDLIKIATYLLAFLSLLIVIVYVGLFYFKNRILNTHWLSFAYWLSMIGVPLAIYYFVSRKEHIIGVYVALGISLFLLLILVILKPWAPPELAEMKHINRLLAQSNSITNSYIDPLKKTRRTRENIFRRFRERLAKKRRHRELMLKGVHEFELSKINKKIEHLSRMSTSKKNIEEIETSIKQREARFVNMNKMLADWADKRRRRIEDIKNQKIRDTLEK